MAIVRWWDPLKDLSSIQDRMNQLFEDTLARSRGREEGVRTGMWTPAVDIYETDQSVVVKAELPGVGKDDIAVEVKEENYHRIERAYGTFLRSFALPVSVDQDKVSARFKDGVLDIELPKKEKAKPRQVKVDVK